MKERDKYGMTEADWARVDAMTEEEVMAAALSDPDAQPSTPEQLAQMRRVSPAKLARRKAKLSQEDFAEAYGIPLETLLAWERYESKPTPTEIAYLKLIMAKPDLAKLDSIKTEAAE